MENNTTKQGPFEGSRCVAGPGGSWGLATVRKLYEDGTFKIEFDVKEMQLMPYWFGVTLEAISFDDADRWAAVFAQISPDGKKFARANFHGALTRLGYPVDAEQAGGFWDQSCQKLFNVSAAQAAGLTLNAESAHRLFLHLGASAKQCADILQEDKDKSQRYFKLYWNQTRMGGRAPSDLRRAVTLDDAFAALGLTQAGVDQPTATFLQEFEQKHDIRLPTALKTFLSRAGVAVAIATCHPNNPELVVLRESEWKLRREMRAHKLNGDYAITIMLPHAGDHQWVAVFDSGENDARVYVQPDTEDEERWLLTAPEIGMFFWDLAQTGLAWFQDTQFKGGSPTKKSDIGLILDA